MLAQQSSLLFAERLFIKAIRQRAGIDPQPAPITSTLVVQVSPDNRAIALNALKRHQTLKNAEAQELIAACLDTRELSADVAKELTGNTFRATSVVGEIAWPLLKQAWSIMPAAAWSYVVFTLQDENAILCAAAAQLLQYGKNVPLPERTQAMAHIRVILADEELSRRPLDTPDGQILRLDDLLYDVLSSLAE